MGGNLFKGRTIRASKEDVYNISSRLRTAFEAAGGRADLIRSYHSKTSFGDVDVLYTLPDGVELQEVIPTLKFEVRDIHKNGDVTSLLVNLTGKTDPTGIQVDLIKSTKQWYPLGDITINCFYFDFNDLGNFMGRVAHRLGFKFGHDGLWYEFRDPECDSRLFRSIPITGNPNAIMNFLGYESGWYWAASEGVDRDFPSTFYNMEGVYEFAASSKYFDPASIMLTNRSYKGRVRDAKRASYNGFIDWLKVRYPDVTDESKLKPVDRIYHLLRAFVEFPKFKEDYSQAVKDLEDLKAFRKVFNGSLIGEWTGLEGKELGELMHCARLYLERNDLQEWVGTLTPEEFKPVFQMIARKLDRRGK